MKKKYRFECQGCRKYKVGTKKPEAELRNNINNVKHTSIYFCSWKCFKEYVKIYLRINGY